MNRKIKSVWRELEWEQLTKVDGWTCKLNPDIFKICEFQICGIDDVARETMEHYRYTELTHHDGFVLFVEHHWGEWEALATGPDHDRLKEYAENFFMRWCDDLDRKANEND